MNIEDLMRRAREHSKNERPKITAFGEVEILRTALAAYRRCYDHRVGDIVRQKPECKLSEKEFSDNSISIVVEIWDAPRPINPANPHDMGTMVIGQWDASDGTFMLVAVDGNRFEPVSEGDL